MFTPTTNKNLQTRLKPYSLEFYRLYDEYSCINYQNYLDLMDLKDLKNASIKELTIDSNFSFKNKSRRDLIELLRNTNIKKIILELNNPSTDFLLLISKLIGKNATILEIELTIKFNYYFVVLAPNFFALFYFINTISSRLVSLNHPNCENGLHYKFYSLLLRNPILKKIQIDNYDYDIYPDSIKDVLSSEKYLDDFRIKNKEAFNNQFYDSLSKIKTKAEIDTLYIDSYNNTEDNDLLATIKNAFLFKIKTIRISEISKLTVFNTIFKLSNNPHNTVKRIIIDASEKNLDEIISEIKSFNLKDYNLKKLPKIYLLYGYQELILDEVNIKNSFFKQIAKDTTSLCLILKRNSIEVNNLTELLYILFNSPTRLRELELRVEYDEKDIELENTNPQYLVENRKRIILRMLEIYDKFKVDKTQFNRSIMNTFEFKFNKNSPELNFIYFTVLEIMILMKFEISVLVLECCPISELNEFLEKHKSLDSLNIDTIGITNCETIDKENIEKLYQYSHLIEDKILIDFNSEYIDMNKESVQIELIDFFNSRSRNYNNFLALRKKYPFMTNELEFDNNNFLPHYILKIKNLKNKLKSYNDIYFCKQIWRLNIDFDRYDLESLSKQFSFLKEYEYDLRSVSFTKTENCSINDCSMMFFMIFEIICNSKYKLSKVNHFQYEIISNMLSKKSKRYLKIHNIVLK